MRGRGAAVGAACWGGEGLVFVERAIGGFRDGMMSGVALKRTWRVVVEGGRGERGVARAGEVCTTAGDRLEWDVATGSLCGSYVAKSAERQRKVLCVMLFRTV